MRGLNHQLKQLCRHNREGSFGTQAQRERQLTLIANQLHELGFRGMHDHSLKPKHVEALIQHWLKTEVATGTIKNRMSALRWWARKVNRQNVVARSNEHYGIPNRQFVSNVTKAKSVLEADLAKVRDEYVRMSLALQQAFGLRREEAIKFMPGYADQGDHLLLKASWTKGGKERTVPIRTEEQRQLLDRAHKLVGRGSLIPGSRNYVQQLRIYEGQTLRAGLSQLHGLRHAYAQQRYEELTGWKSSAAGGPPTKALTPDQKAKDRETRLIISKELGHEREQITAVYLGR
ncbi:MAG: integrase domain-containing protein [Gammaproteobacteria bacterium]|nr:integrase domain-containing protein [Gammaproteobacteria bacterium]MDH4314308.1 integrase domain-containing protein [Gammaproteobacteria bacterium]MDH5215290.1 integrase domain-containing protein [Gammaproteobacteria bacterium]